MAEGDEKKSVAGAGGGGHDKGKVKLPKGFRFKPTDEEIIEYYLLPRLQGRPTEPNDAIIEANVYEFHPDTLINEIYRSRGKGEWFFLSTRARMYQNGVRPSRKTEDGRGRWKASTATKVVAEETVSNGIRFCKNVLNYFAGSTKDEVRTKWLMRELTIPEYEVKRGDSGANETLDEYVMCKIYLSPVHKTSDDDDSGDSPACELPERQNGKRPLEAQSRGHAAARKQARQGSLTIGRTQPNGPVPTIYCLPVQPTRYNVQAPLQQRQSGMHNNGQAQQPGGAFNAQELVQRTPIPTQFQPNAAATSNANSFGRMTTMMVRPPSMGFPGTPLRQDPGTGFRPQVSLRCHYEQNYGAVQQPQGNAAYGTPQQRTMAFAPPPPPQQFFNVNADDFAGAFASTWPPSYNGNPYKGSSMEQKAGDQAQAAEPGTANAGNGNMNAEHHFVELVAINTSLAGARQQTAAVPDIELATPKEETGVEETSTHASSLHKQDTA